jgi:hypothetical protein
LSAADSLSHPSGSENRSFMVTLRPALMLKRGPTDERARLARAGARVEPGRNGGLAGRRRCGGASGVGARGARSDCARERRNAPSVSEILAARIVPSASGASARRAKRRAWVSVKSSKRSHTDTTEITKHAVHYDNFGKGISKVH